MDGIGQERIVRDSTVLDWQQRSVADGRELEWRGGCSGRTGQEGKRLDGNGADGSRSAARDWAGVEAAGSALNVVAATEGIVRIRIGRDRCG